MAKYKGKKQKNVETVAESICNFFRYLLDLCICIYMLLILVIMPFYYEEGFSHIGTDKSTFFKKCITYGGKIALPLFLIAVIMQLAVFIQKNGWPKWNKEFLKNIVSNWKKQFSMTDYFAFAYGIVVVLSYASSAYKEEALWGTTGWYMGMIPQLASIVVYFLISRAWTGRKWIVAMILPVSAVVFVLGYLNRFGIYPIDMQLELPSFISTIGNINWYCGYLVSVFFGGMFVLWQVDWKKTWQQLLMMLYVTIGFATLATQGSNSGIFALVAVVLVLFGLSASDGRRMEMFWMEMVLFSITCVVTYVLRYGDVLVSTLRDAITDLICYSSFSVVMTTVSTIFLIWVYYSNKKGRYPKKVFTTLSRMAGITFLAALGCYVVILIVNTVSGDMISNMLPASLKQWVTFSTTWGSRRGATWRAGAQCFTEQDFLHKLVGVGPDCMAAFLYNNGSSELVDMVKAAFGDARLTNAHNEWLTILVDSGVLGMISFAGMMCTAIKRFLSGHRQHVMIGACGISVLAYTVNNMFSFQQSMSLATIFVVLGIGENFLRRDKIR